MSRKLKAMPGSQPGDIVLYTEVTTHCTNRCDFCPIDLVNRSGFIKEEVQMKVIDLISSFPHRKFVVYPHLVGEPLMYQGLENYIQSLASLPNVELWLCTNGVLLDNFRIRSLYDSGLRNIWYSLFYSTGSYYQRHTHSDNFDRAMKNLYLLLSQNQLFEKIHIVLFSEDNREIEHAIRHKENVTIEVHRKAHPWRTEGRYFKEKLFHLIFSKIGKFRTKYICVSIDGAVCFDWRNYNFYSALGNISNLEATLIMKQIETGHIDKAKRIFWR